MKLLLKTIVWILVSILLVLLALFALVYRNMRPTQGPRIGSYAAPRAALLVVDIQEDFTGPQALKRFRDEGRIITVSNALIAQAQAKGMPVIFIQNIVDNPLLAFAAGGVNAPGAPGTEMDRRLLRAAGVQTFPKRRSDAFSNPELDAFLRRNSVDRLLITGLDAAYCVNATTRGALNRGYGVTLYTDGLATQTSKSLEDLARAWRALGAQTRTGSEL